MGESAQLSFALKIAGEFLSIWASFPQISKFFGWTMDEIRPNRKKFARNFWGRTSTARIRPVRSKKYLLCSYKQQKLICQEREFRMILELNLLTSKKNPEIKSTFNSNPNFAQKITKNSWFAFKFSKYQKNFFLRMSWLHAKIFIEFI
jgi:hypothetical protein